jgi:hypothetical protein
MTAVAASDANRATKIQIVAQGDALVVKTGGTINVESGGALQIGGTDLTSTIAALANNTARYVSAGATKTLTAANDKQTIKLDTLAGSVVTLPAATGSGVKFKFLVTVLATSASHKIQVANASDFMVGIINGERVDTANTVLGFAAANSGTVATNSDTITLNRTTTGSVTVGEWLEVEDVAANTWAVNGMLSATGALFATPFTAAV